MDLELTMDLETMLLVVHLLPLVRRVLLRVTIMDLEQRMDLVVHLLSSKTTSQCPNSMQSAPLLHPLAN